MSAKDWVDGPRPSFFGRLLPTRQNDLLGEELEDQTRRFSRRRLRPLSGHPAFKERINGRNTPATSDDDAGWRTTALDTKPDDGHSQAIEREAYVRAELLDRFMRDNSVRRLVAAGLAPLLIAICWGYVSSERLFAWFGVGLLVGIMRSLAAQIYARRYASATTEARGAYLRRIRPLWFASAVVWGSSAMLFFDRIPLDRQYLCWVVVASVASFPTASLALHPPVLRRYLNTFAVVVLACVAYRIFTTPATVQHEPWVLLLILALWLLLFHIARRLHASARENLELHFDKNALIASLAAKRRQAEEAVQIKNRFLATATHDMRQPVMALSLYADHLLSMPDQHGIVVPKIAKAAAAVNKLFDSLFDLARLDNGQTRVRIEPVDISEIMHDLQGQYEPIAEVKAIELRMRTCRRELMTDSTLARRMIGNLVSNAIKYSPPGSKVLMSARVRAAGLVVEVWDQGIGIAPDELDKIFLEFYKVDAVGASEGFGLGLAIVARLAHALDTQVSVQSRPGRGTVFRLVMAKARLAPAAV